MFTFFLSANNPTFPAYNNITVAVKYSSSYVYVGQLVMNTMNETFPNATQPANSAYGFAYMTSVNVKTQSYGVGSYILKVPPVSYHGYYLQTSIALYFFFRMLQVIIFTLCFT